MNLNQEGVNENGGVSAPVVNSPVTQTQTQIVESAAEAQGTQSTETLNTGKIPESVPYQRFKEVNDKAKAAEELLYEIYQTIHASENSETKPTPVKESPSANAPTDPVALLAQEVAQLKAEKNQERRLSAVDSYDRAYEQKASQEVPQELREVFDEMVAQRVLAANKGVPTSFDQKILDKAYNDTKKLFEPAMNRLKPVAAAQNVPQAVPGDPPIKPTQAPRTFEERRAFIQKAMESGKRFF